MVSTWNSHLIRPSTNARVPSGKPTIMYNMPELYGAVDWKCAVPLQELNVCKNESLFREPIPCDNDVFDLCCELMADHGYTLPKDAHEGINLYGALRNEIMGLM